MQFANHSFLEEQVLSEIVPIIDLIIREMFANAIRFPEICPDVVHVCFWFV